MVECLPSAQVPLVELTVSGRHCGVESTHYSAHVIKVRSYTQVMEDCALGNQIQLSIWQ